MKVAHYIPHSLLETFAAGRDTACAPTDFYNWSLALLQLALDCKSPTTELSLCAGRYIEFCQKTSELAQAGKSKHLEVPVGHSLRIAFENISMNYDGTRLTDPEKDIVTAGFLLSDNPDHRATSFAASEAGHMNFYDIVKTILNGCEKEGAITRERKESLLNALNDVAWALYERQNAWCDRQPRRHDDRLHDATAAAASEFKPA